MDLQGHVEDSDYVRLQLDEDCVIVYNKRFNLYCRFRCMEPYGPKPCMGIHMTVVREGEIKVGDPVYAVRK